MRTRFIIGLVMSVASCAFSGVIQVANPSFESPQIDPNGFGVVPYVDGWEELDRDQIGSTNTGVFLNTPQGSWDRVLNAQGLQLAFLGSQQGNGFQQELDIPYQGRSVYRLSVGVGVSSRFPPSATDGLALEFYYQDEAGRHLVASHVVPAEGLTGSRLEYVDLYLIVDGSEPFVGKGIGMGIVAEGQAGGFWVLDDVELYQWSALTVHVANPSFEYPVLEPNRPVDVKIQDWSLVSTGQGLGTGIVPMPGLPGIHGQQVCLIWPGTGIYQDLQARFRPGCSYLLSADLGHSHLEGTHATTLRLALQSAGDKSVQDVAGIGMTGLPGHAGLVNQVLHTGLVRPDDPWAGRSIRVAVRVDGEGLDHWLVDGVRVLELMDQSIEVANGSFEYPVIDPNGFGVVPYAQDWVEVDNDALGSTNTGVFLNTPEGRPDRLVNAGGLQLAFLGSQQGNGFCQGLAASYLAGQAYRLVVEVGISSRFPPADSDMLELALYYDGAQGASDIVTRSIGTQGLSASRLVSVDLYLPAATEDQPWVGKGIGLAIRAAGQAGGFWVLDEVGLSRSGPFEDR